MLSFDANEGGVRCIVVDPNTGYGYCGLLGQYGSVPGVVKKFYFPSMELVDSLSLESDEWGATACCIDTEGGYLYVGTYTVPGKIIKIRLSDFTRVDTLELAAGANYLVSAVIDTEAGLAYFGTWTAPGYIVVIDLATFTAAWVAWSPGVDFFWAAAFDPTTQFVYFGSYDDPPTILKFRWPLDPASGTLTLPAGTYGIHASVCDVGAGILYCATATYPAQLYRVNLGTFTYVDSLQFASGENAAYAGVLDISNGYTLWCCRASGHLVMVGRDTFERVASYELPDTMQLPRCAVMDPVHGKSFWGLDESSPAGVFSVCHDTPTVWYQLSTDGLSWTTITPQPFGVKYAAYAAVQEVMDLTRRGHGYASLVWDWGETLVRGDDVYTLQSFCPPPAQSAEVYVRSRLRRVNQHGVEDWGEFFGLMTALQYGDYWHKMEYPYWDGNVVMFDRLVSTCDVKAEEIGEV